MQHIMQLGLGTGPWCSKIIAFQKGNNSPCDYSLCILLQSKYHLWQEAIGQRKQLYSTRIWDMGS